MKILLFVNPKGLMERDFAHTLRKRGIEVLEEKLNFGFTPEGHSVEMFNHEGMVSILDSFRPDLIFSFNGFGVDDGGVLSGEYARRGIPYATWFVDRPRTADIKEKYSRSNTFMFVFDRVYIDTLKAAGFERVTYLPLATNPDRFRPLPHVPGEEAVCFIGDLDYSTIQYLAKNIDAMITGADDRFFALVEEAILEQRKSVGRDTWLVIEEVLGGGGYNVREFPQMLRDIFEGFVEREASLRQRIEAVEALMGKFPVAVFGDELWKEVAGPAFKGRVNYFDDAIVEVYNRYAIHVNISKYQLRWAINQRPYDVPACGGFLITDLRQDLREVFSPEEMVSFTTPDELVEQVERFFGNAPLREEYSRRAREKVLSGHTYEQRIDAVLQEVFGSSGWL